LISISLWREEIEGQFEATSKSLITTRRAYLGPNSKKSPRPKQKAQQEKTWASNDCKFAREGSVDSPRWRS
jgi:hypothetical protein